MIDDQVGVERALGRLEGKIDALDVKIDSKLESVTGRLHEVEVRQAVVEATAITPRRLLGVMAMAAAITSVIVGLLFTIGDRLWGG